jgi:hypothetical protein
MGAITGAHDGDVPSDRTFRHEAALQAPRRFFACASKAICFAASKSGGAARHANQSRRYTPSEACCIFRADFRISYFTRWMARNDHAQLFAGVAELPEGKASRWRCVACGRARLLPFLLQHDPDAARRHRTNPACVSAFAWPPLGEMLGNRRAGAITGDEAFATRRFSSPSLSRSAVPRQTKDKLATPSKPRALWM